MRFNERYTEDGDGNGRQGVAEKLRLGDCAICFVRSDLSRTKVEGLRSRIYKELKMTEKHRVNFLTVSQNYDLNVACRGIGNLFESYGVFHVGSSLTRPDYRDVDLRCILPNKEFDKMFHGEQRDARLKFLNVAISEWIQARTGLPIDFQFQRLTDANDEFKGTRNSVGVGT